MKLHSSLFFQPFEDVETILGLKATQKQAVCLARGYREGACLPGTRGQCADHIGREAENGEGCQHPLRLILQERKLRLWELLTGPGNRLSLALSGSFAWVPSAFATTVWRRGKTHPLRDKRSCPRRGAFSV